MDGFNTQSRQEQILKAVVANIFSESDTPETPTSLMIYKSKNLRDFALYNDLDHITGDLWIGDTLFNPFVNYNVSITSDRMKSRVERILKERTDLHWVNRLYDLDCIDELNSGYHTLKFLNKSDPDLIINLVEISELESPSSILDRLDDGNLSGGKTLLHYPICFGESPRSSSREFLMSNFNENLVERACRRLREGKNVSLHCCNDMQRSTLVASCILLKCFFNSSKKVSLSSLFYFAQEVCPENKLNVFQLEFLYEFALFLGSNQEMPSAESFQSLLISAKNYVIDDNLVKAHQEFDKLCSNVDDRFLTLKLMMATKDVEKYHWYRNFEEFQDPIDLIIQIWFAIHHNQLDTAKDLAEKCLCLNSASILAYKLAIKICLRREEPKLAHCFCLKLLRITSHQEITPDTIFDCCNNIDGEELKLHNLLNFFGSKVDPSVDGELISNSGDSEAEGEDVEDLANVSDDEKSLSFEKLNIEDDEENLGSSFEGVDHCSLDGDEEERKLERICFNRSDDISQNTSTPLSKLRDLYPDYLRNIDYGSNYQVTFARHSVKIGLSLEDIGLRSQAIAFFAKALELDPTDINTYSRKAKLLNDEKRHSAALLCLNVALDVAPNDYRLYYNKGMTQLEMGNQNDALRTFEKGLQYSIEFPNLYAGKGIALLGLERYQEAVNCFDIAIDLDRSEVKYHVFKGNCLSKLKKYRTALACYDVACELSGETPELCNNRGAAFCGLGRFADGSACFQKAKLLDKNMREAQNNLNRIHQKMRPKKEHDECVSF
eukprot:CAMPEP_0114976264 /NCGR_PEP_ID=MMETSP0216-20121206/2571_1 /TAXON_ID=223996 /ORGANISM="Protocruzia adherens, Strain Boccale" /LENGTH=776 /DNA_ID=CAMNT_0002337163 /DNA_START=47 /DNA_END=2380 /DNA_ORIENTATION=+